MKLIIAGGRNYRIESSDIINLNQIDDVTEVVSGGAKGADYYGELWAETRGIPVRLFLADWIKYGKSAGAIRNREMARYADAVVLLPGGNGTNSMFEEAKKAGLKIFDWRIPIADNPDADASGKKS